MSTEPITPTVEEQEAAVVERPTLADHRAAFPDTPRHPTLTPSGEEPAKAAPRRAQSHKASPDDLPTIEALTKELREAEDALKIEKKAGESDRVYQLRRRAEIAKRAAAAANAPVARPVLPTPQRTAPVVAASTTATAFTEAEPTLAQFADKADPYGALQRALAAYDRRKERFDEQQAATKQQSESAIRTAKEAFDAEMVKGVESHALRIGAAIESDPEFKALCDAEAAKPLREQIGLPLALRGAIEFHDQGPLFLKALLQDPVFADELFVLTNGQQVGDPRSDPLVAVVRRRLLQRVQGVTTGAPAPARPVVAPRPPTPVRTAPLPPREKVSSGEAMSLAEHRKQFPLPTRP